jgi:hypothetical protein
MFINVYTNIFAKLENGWGRGEGMKVPAKVPQ